MTRAADLGNRFNTIDNRLRIVESKLVCNDHASRSANSCDYAALQQRYAAVHSRLAAVEHQLALGAPSDAGRSDSTAPAYTRSEGDAASHPVVLQAATTAAAPPSRPPAACAETAAALAAPHGTSAWRDDPPSDTQRRLAAELDAEGVVPYSFLRVVKTYYDHSLEWRRECLGAPSVFHLCKSMVMHNTRADDAPGCALPRYFLVILQYAASVHAEKLKKVLHRAANRDRPAGQTIGKQFFNPRLVPEEVSDQLTGFQHNAVSPIGLATDLPIVMSDRVAALQPPVFWLGGGEADLKMCLPVHPFLESYRPTVVDCTDDKRTMVE